MRSQHSPGSPRRSDSQRAPHRWRGMLRSMPRSESHTREMSDAALAPTLQPEAAHVYVDVRPRPLGDLGFEERYQARGRIGEGGMGEVLLCWDERIGREVAMKVLLVGD